MHNVLNALISSSPFPTPKVGIFCIHRHNLLTSPILVNRIIIEIGAKLLIMPNRVVSLSRRVCVRAAEFMRV